MKAREESDVRRGFTLVETMVATTLAMIVLGAVLGVAVSQLRRFDLHQQSADANETVRGAAAFLSDEFRAASAIRGDITGLDPFSVMLRTTQGTGVICAIDASAGRYALDLANGEFATTPDDSLLAYRPGPNAWTNLKVTGVWADPVAGGISACAAPSTATPDVVIQVAGDTAGVETGSDVIAFRQTEYGIFQQGGRWWLGQRYATAGSYGRLTGPLLAPSDSGLVFHYFDAAGGETMDGSQIARVEIVLRSQSYRKVRSGMGVAERRDSTSFTVSIRN